MRAVNLLPPDTRGASKASAELGAGPEAKGGAGAFVVLGVLAACVAGTAGVVLADNTIKQRSVDLAEVAQQQQVLQRQAAQLKPYADFDAMAKTRVQTVKDLAGSRFDWEQALRDLSRAIPADVTLSVAHRRHLQRRRRRRQRAAQRDLRPGDHASRAAPRRRRQVARLMARLHDIDGVTRVSLSNSAAEKVDEPDSTDGSASEQRNATPCGAGSARSSSSSCSSRRTRPPSPRRRRPRPAPSARRRRRPRRRAPRLDRRHHCRRVDDHHDDHPGRGDAVSRTYRVLLVAVVVASPPSAATGSWSSRPSARRPPSSSRRSPRSRPSSRRRSS